jgi:hypothetical protein
MSDGIVLSTNIGTGETLDTDELASGKHAQRVKLLDGNSDSATQILAGNGTAANGLRVSLASDSTGQVKLATSAAEIGKLAAGTASIGSVTLGAGTAAIGVVEAAGSVAHDAAGTSIKPVLGGAICYEMDSTQPGTACAEGDVSYLKSDLDGRQLVNTQHPASSHALDETSSARTAQQLVAQPAAGFSIYITHIQMSAITAQTAFLHDEDDTVVFPLQYFGANTGIVSVNLSSNPIRLTHAKALEYTSTAAVASSCFVSYFVAP